MASLSYHERVDVALWAGDPELALDVVEAAYDASHGGAPSVWEGFTRHLVRQPAGDRSRLLAAMPARHDKAPPGSGWRSALLYLAVLLGHDLPDDILVTERQAALTSIENDWFYPAATRFHVLAKAELDAGRPVSDRLVAVFRRSAECHHHREVRRLVAGVREPVLNVGEAWAEAALADAASPGAPWGPLLAHIVTAKAARPSATWERKAQRLIAEIGAEPLQERVVAWLSLVGLPRTVPVRRDRPGAPASDLFDPYNANALRGLVWLLCLIEPRLDTVKALGSLAHTGLRATSGQGARTPKVVNAAVHALARLSHPAARQELDRLAKVTSAHGAHKLIAAALAGASAGATGA